jgi:hypothetical protein
VSSTHTAGVSDAARRLPRGDQGEGYDVKGDEPEAEGSAPAVRQVGEYRVEADLFVYILSSVRMDGIKATQ